ncbi:MAG TPA: DNA topoisomerase IB [Solirubrobacteraceae bacterium]|nr:DNA topoisomerase IB [Solirubrobacteraceae bacterium]
MRHGRGLGYVDDSGERVKDAATLERIGDLAIPPAWDEVWICPDPQGHLQATGIDSAGRKQYRYHDAWRRRRDREKFRRMLEFGRALPKLRREVTRDLETRGLNRDRVLACAVRLIDSGLFRVGGEEYAEEGGGLGVATLGKRHVSASNGVMRFDYPAKSGVRRVQDVDEAACAKVIRALKARHGGGSKLLAYTAHGTWFRVRADDINEYIQQRIGEDFSAKDFRTWNATVLAAVLLATESGADTNGARKRTIDAAVRGVSEALGNTPAVARRAYIDPHLFDRYRSGWTVAPALPASAKIGPRVRGRLEAAVIDLLSDDERSRALEHRRA